MKTVQMTLDENLVEEIDRISRELKLSRSGFTRQALREAIARYEVEQMERRHRQGYTRKPVARDEFADWEREREREQEWGEE